MRRWLHDTFNRHTWRELAHYHAFDDHEGPVIYELEECRCGALRELEYDYHALLSPFPGVTAAFVEVSISDLANLEDAKVWSTS